MHQAELFGQQKCLAGRETPKAIDTVDTGSLALAPLFSYLLMQMCISSPNFSNSNTVSLRREKISYSQYLRYWHVFSSIVTATIRFLKICNIWSGFLTSSKV